MNELPTFKIRCSAIGTIMTAPRGKSMAEKIAELAGKIQTATERHDALKPGLKSKEALQGRILKMQEELASMLPYKDAPNLSASCISYLQKWCNETLYGRKKEFTSKQTDKGNLVEEDAILYASGHVIDMGLCSKNEEHFIGEYMHGTPDVLTENYVFDIKSAWDHDTFPLHSPEIPTEDYVWQVKGYMHLTGRRMARVVYVLMSMPDEMLYREARWKLGQEFTKEEFDEWAKMYRYDELPPCLRIKEFEVVWNEDDIAAIEKRVKECRQYIEDVIKPELQKNVRRYGDDE